MPTATRLPASPPAAPARRVFLTGATGYVGSAIAHALLDGGCHVSALVRSDAAAARLPRGVEPVVGDLRATGRWIAAARAADAAVHAGYEYDAAGREVHETDHAATHALLDAAGAGGPLRHAVYTSNAYLFGDHPAGAVDEDTPATTSWPAPAPRLDLERAVRAHPAGAAVRVGMVYGRAAGGAFGGTMPALLGALAAGDPLPALATRRTRWSLVHVQDLAALYARVVAQGATGVFHGTDGAPLPVAAVVDLARRALEGAGHAGGAGSEGPGAGPAAPPGAFGEEHLGRLAADVALLPRASAALGWAPRVTTWHAGAVPTVHEWLAARAAPA